MREVRLLHESAMEKAEEAVRHRTRGRKDEASEAIRAAYLLEERAAMHLLNNHDAEPSRGILFRSAASLAIEAEEFRAAERLACMGMIGNPPTEVMDELREAYERAQFRRHLEARGVVLSPHQVQMALAGAAIAPAMAESTEFTNRVNAAEKLFIRTWERKAKLAYRQQGEIPQDTRDKVSLFVSVPRSGSFTVTFQIGGPQLHLFTPPREIISEVLECFDLWQRNDEKGLRERIPEDEYRRNFTSLVREIAPDGERVNFVGFTTSDGGTDRTVQLTRRTERPPPRRGGRPKVQTVTGVLKHADARSSDPKKHKICVVQDDQSEVYVRVLAGHEDVVKAHYGDYVTVTMERAPPKTGGGYVFKHIEKASRS